MIRKFRECSHYSDPPSSEKEMQTILWIMLRSHYDRLERESTLPRFGTKAYVPDFGIPDLRTLVEAKYIGPKTSVSEVQEQVLADVPGYLNKSTGYEALVVVYDAGRKLRDSRKFEEDLRKVDGIVDVIVVH